MIGTGPGRPEDCGFLRWCVAVLARLAVTAHDTRFLANSETTTLEEDKGFGK